MLNHRKHPVFAGAALLAALCWTAAWAAPADLDLTFSGDGKLTTAVGASHDTGYSVAVQADGKTLLGGGSYNGSNEDFALARYNADGTLDPTFSGDGKLTTAVGADYDVGHSVAVQADGKILLGGYSINGSYPGFALARYNADGTLDSSFDGDGKLTTAVGAGYAVGLSVAVQADGKILLGGGSYNGSNEDFALARYNADGTLDPTFSGDGKLTTALGAADDTGYSVAVQADGKILLGGYSYNGSNYDFALVRYNADGTLDPTFSGDGKLTTALGASQDLGHSVAVQADGKILLGGHSINGSYYDFALVRYNADGTLDPTFDGDGKLTTALGAAQDEGHSVAVQADGKILLGGKSYNGSNYDFALVRYNADGTLDSSFDGDGKLTTAVGADYAAGHSVAVQADGKILLGGHSINGSNYDFALVRYLGDPTDTLSPTCRVGGVVSGATVYVPVTVSDNGSGVASVQLTTNSSNCKLEWDGPGGLVTVPIGGTIPITPAATSTVVRAVKLNNTQKARVELRVTDAAGNSIVCDPVIANLDLKKGRQLVRTFKGIPAHEHYVTLQNGTPGLATAKLQVNGKTVSSGTLTDGQVVTLDVAQWMRPGTKNTVRIAVTGPKGGTAVLLIGDASLAGGTHTPGTHAAGARKVSLEFSR